MFTTECWMIRCKGSVVRWCSGLCGVLSLSVLTIGWATAQDLDLLNATVIDGTGAPARAVAAVQVRGGKIVAIKDHVPSADAGVKRIDLTGRYLLPGLIDAHTHISSPDAAARALQSGVTTARSLGDSYHQAQGTRDLIRAGHVPGPELLVASSIIRPRPGAGFFVTYPQFGAAYGGELRGPELIAAVTRAMLASGVDVIKVSASERAGLPSTDPRRNELTEEEMHAAVVEAGRAGRYVAVHAYSRSGLAAAVRAGVRSIEHGAYMDDDTLKEMKRRGTFLVPTLAVLSPLSDPLSRRADDVVLQIRTQQVMGPIRSVVRKAKAMGVVVAAATDGGYDDGSPTSRIRVADDMAIMVNDCGFTPLEAISAATLNGARVLGIEARTGTIRTGLEADMMVLERDPLRDMSALFEPVLVISNGSVAVERL